MVTSVIVVQIIIFFPYPMQERFGPAMVWQMTVVEEVHVAMYANQDISKKQANSGHW